jgi:hypothetical protein
MHAGHAGFWFTNKFTCSAARLTLIICKQLIFSALIMLARFTLFVDVSAPKHKKKDFTRKTLTWHLPNFLAH